jgi:hypothetical protein
MGGIISDGEKCLTDFTQTINKVLSAGCNRVAGASFFVFLQFLPVLLQIPRAWLGKTRHDFVLSDAYLGVCL